MGQEQGIPWIL
uniref:Protein PB1-F2 n=1 Tax=Influenza A virus (strain A/Swine/Wisconsin/1/1961 H1N1) TaxID=383533 RepID=PB1F2_I61A1|nr:RecName: Full=Protein PB1-F2 [Influenza A virus (A/swine/Wisconsin/1/1961(H1N1))]